MIKTFLNITLLFFIFSGCHKHCIPREYQFNGGIASIYPDKDSIQVGDTLWFTCSVPLDLKYKLGNSLDSENYNISGAENFRTDFQITTPLGVNMQTGAIEAFSFITGQGDFQSEPLATSARKIISFEEENNKYIFSLGLVAIKKGIYFLDILDIYQGMKKCDKFSVIITMNDADNHLHYLKDIYYGDAPIDPIDSTHSYCFKVY